MNLLKELCSVQAPSGHEDKMTLFLLQYIEENKSKWKNQPEIFSGEDFQNCIVLSFGKPRTAVFAHIDNIGFTVRYNKKLVKIGGPTVTDGMQLIGTDAQGEVKCTIEVSDNNLVYNADRDIERGTELSFAPDWRETEQYVQCCYMDNRLGVWNALRLCEDLEDGIVVFSCWEEHGGGSVPYIVRFLWEKYKIRKTLISDITWVTEGVKAGEGVAISIRDSGIPRRKYVNEIIELAKKSGIPFQLEIEGSGGSDGTEIQKQAYPVDWCFIGAPEENVHSPDEKVDKKDISSMLLLYKFLMKHL